MFLMQLIPANHTIQDGENHTGPAQQGALPHWTCCQSDATQTFLCVYMKTGTLLWKKILPGSFSVNTPLVSFIVNSEQHPASGIVSTPLPGNNLSGFRVDRIFPSVCSNFTSSSLPSPPSASSTFFYCYLGWENTLWNLSTHHRAICWFSVTCFILVLKKKFWHLFVVLSWVSLGPGSCYDPTNLCIRSFEHNPAGIRDRKSVV